MFAFKIWGKFGCFKDPLSISQNITLNLPPKTTISGMMASILGNDSYLEDEKFNNFTYSVVLLKPIIKKSFSQNYINDYTKTSLTFLNELKRNSFEKIQKGMTSPKPINRELIINPSYLVFIKDFKYKDEIVNNLKNKICRFPFYMGNSEFAGNFEFIEVKNFEEKNFEEVDLNSFIEEDFSKHIDFIQGQIYSSVAFTTKLDANRSPIEVKNVIYSNNFIKSKNIKAHKITLEDKKYFCRFI